jgi:hypothetical protein
MSFAQYSNYDGLALAELVRKKKVKPSELVEAAIERIERHNPRLNAIVFKAYDEARAKATTKLSGAFVGVPMLLKDITRKDGPLAAAPVSCQRCPQPLMRRRSRASKQRASSPLARPTCRNSASCPSPSRSSTAPRAILGI